MLDFTLPELFADLLPDAVLLPRREPYWEELEPHVAQLDAASRQHLIEIAIALRIAAAMQHGGDQSSHYASSDSSKRRSKM